ncbi:hypothetical protein RFI_10644 [Reticulomyxa filosa]|uniref:Uncharacterized protein n=1 Tax=Reticulomyxa filosa TaxID=46433 RepID=X6NJL4_RETFI|nr:hypothetical protein RFI_10644 [Reticulomyxa filosa]|eukprot:ETO26495.1 hypothetical protein RFI_10644 [Reticulomyxa filosa]
MKKKINSNYKIILNINESKIQNCEHRFALHNEMKKIYERICVTISDKLEVKKKNDITTPDAKENFFKKKQFVKKKIYISYFKKFSLLWCVTILKLEYCH